jgi:hypothetical protein
MKIKKLHLLLKREHFKLKSHKAQVNNPSQHVDTHLN